MRDAEDRLIDLNLTEFADKTASESPAPGGGSVSAYLGALGASLGAMVANLSAHKRGWDDKWEFYSNWAVQGQNLKNELLRLVDADTAAFNEVLAGFRMPKGTDEEKAARKAAIEEATKGAIQVPLDVMRTSAKAFPLLKEMATSGLKSSISDAGVGALAARAAIRGAGMNVLINLDGLDDADYKSACVAEQSRLETEAEAAEAEILELVRSAIS